jgi:hypothetical protein
MTLSTFNLGVSLPSNAILTFTIPGNGTQTDPVTGNVSPNTLDVEVNASLTELGDKSTEEEQIGLDSRFRKMRGYVLGNPPSGIILKGRIPCKIGTEEGIFHFTERISPFRSEIIKQVGIPVQGSFQTEGGGS